MRRYADKDVILNPETQRLMHDMCTVMEIFGISMAIVGIISIIKGS